MVKLKKLKIGASTVILSSGLLFGCAAPNLDNDDEQESDPTEEPSEQQDQNGQDNNNQDNNDKNGIEDILQPGHQ
ncbi:hypothetical protein [Lentibacillus sp.]|jgi:hypothetical protein|uniref:hypothetical protein n=1 Tax=Lentibacillus sp. TaxID=1925746 RepID=UPI002B4B493D|nr:hypothetical protein [Lentibacillus sp.]HLS08421.1 hypothetical protein [Lentibacillus sp.]